MALIDLSRELFHRTPTLPNHPPVIMTEFGTHADILVSDLEQAEQRAGVKIEPRDTVLLYMAVHERLFGTPGYVTDFPGLTKESAEWLGGKGIDHMGASKGPRNPQMLGAPRGTRGAPRFRRQACSIS